jgi:hypothetical protein
MRSLGSALVRAWAAPFVVIALLTLVVGCAGRGDISGKVTYKGKALVFGTVQMEAADKTFKQANIEPDGSFSIPGVPVGEAHVAVSSANPQSSDFVPLHAGPRLKAKAVTGWFPIPGEYADLTKSPLTYTVKRGPNTYDIELKDSK